MKPNPQSDRSLLLVIAGHDPTGGAGIQADIEAAAAFGVHAATVISCLTVQDTENVHSLEPVDTKRVRQTIETLLADMPATCCKLGLLGSAETVEMVAALLPERGIDNLVLDPVLAAGGGSELSGEQLRQAIIRHLIPLATLITPNLPEAQKLSGRTPAEECAAEMTQRGCAHVLITGGHNDEQAVVNRLFDANGQIGEWSWPRLPHGYHGSGCTLASASAALMAKGIDVVTAVDQAQHFTWRALSNAMTLGRAQLIPNRLNHS